MEHAVAHQLKRKKWHVKKKVELPFRYRDETVELALNLNLDVRKPGQALRGTIRMPHGSGKKSQCIVFSKDEDTVKAALEKGATVAGGEDLIEKIVKGEVPIKKLERGLGTAEMTPLLTQKAARILGPRGLMPNLKVGTLFESDQDLLDGLETKIMGKDVVYRTETDGIVHVPVGKVSFGLQKLLENIGEAVSELHSVMPDSFGKGKKPKAAGSKGHKYILRAHLSSTQGPGYKLDLKTIDPNSNMFLQDPEAVKAAFAASSAQAMAAASAANDDSDDNDNKNETVATDDSGDQPKEPETEKTTTTATSTSTTASTSD